MDDFSSISIWKCNYSQRRTRSHYNRDMFPCEQCQRGLQNYNHSWFRLILGPSLLFPSHLYGQVFPSASKREEKEVWTEMTRRKVVLCKRNKLMWGYQIVCVKKQDVCLILCDHNLSKMRCANAKYVSYRELK